MISRLARIFALLAVACAPVVAFAQSPKIDAKSAVRPVVVELFSSQSCGNCPIANKNIGELTKRGDIIALTYPVGYWNYLGWDDTFAKPIFTERQKEYNRSMGYRGPYTPQVVFGGIVHSSGVKLKKIQANLSTYERAPYPAKVEFKGDRVFIDGEATGNGPAAVMLIQVKGGDTKVTPEAGENSGRSMTYTNLVTNVEQIGSWSGGSASFLTPNCNKGCTVLVQRDSATGRVIGAAQK